MPKLSIGVLMSWNLAAIEALKANCEMITPEMLFCGIVKLESMTSPELLNELGFSLLNQRAFLSEVEKISSVFLATGLKPKKIYQRLRNIIGIGDFTRDNKVKSVVHRSDITKQVFNNAARLTPWYRNRLVTLGHLLVAMLDIKSSKTIYVLTGLGIEVDSLKSAIARISINPDTTLSPKEAKRLLESIRNHSDMSEFSFTNESTGEAKDPIDIVITNEELVDELAPPSSISEDERISVLAQIMDIVTHAQTNGEIYEGCIQKIFNAIPNAERVTILIEQNDEFLPVKYFPRVQAYFSNTFVNKARDSKQAFSWRLNSKEKAKTPESMFDAVAAMYTPMIRDNRVIGVLHVDSTSLISGFSKLELDALSVIAGGLALSLKRSKGNGRTPSVFISYSHKDAEIVNRLKGDLRRNGISVWVDERLKIADVAWRKQLAVAINEQRFFIIILTPDSVTSSYCEWELDTALSLNKSVIPLMVKKTNLPFTISTLQYIDFQRDYSQALNLLVRTLQRK